MTQEGHPPVTALNRARTGARARRVFRRVVVEGRLILLTPAHLGNGDGDALVDMPLLRDAAGQRPLLTGASIAGALRGYLREHRHGYGKRADKHSASVVLFGGLKADPDGEQSPLIVDDALGSADGVELRDGVALNPQTRTAADDKLYDLELWPAGTTFPLRFELLVCEGGAPEGDLKRALATALQGFENGAIALGARKRRGYGRVRVDDWRVTEYDLKQASGLLSWLMSDLESDDRTAYDLPGVVLPPARDGLAALGQALGDAREWFSLGAAFTLDGSMLIRGNLGPEPPVVDGKEPVVPGPDMVHIHTRVWDASAVKWRVAPILSGTSLAGALRARALKIALTLTATPAQAEVAARLVDGMFGPDMGMPGATPAASRVVVEESAIVGGRGDLVQNRVSIDRFTGGAKETALFDEQPLFGNDEARVTIRLKLWNPSDREIGLLSLLLKDLWTGDLPLGGEISAGRGRLRGRQAELILKRGEAGEQCWVIEAGGDGGLRPLDAVARDALNGCVMALGACLREVN